MRCRYHHEHQQPGCFHSHPQFSKQHRVMALHCRSPIMTPVCLEIPLVLAHRAMPHGPATWLSFLLVPWHASLRIDFLTLTPLLTNAACGLLSDSRLRIELTTPGACSSCEPGIWGVCCARFGLSIPNGNVLWGQIEGRQGIRQWGVARAWQALQLLDKPTLFVCFRPSAKIGVRRVTKFQQKLLALTAYRGCPGVPGVRHGP